MHVSFIKSLKRDSKEILLFSEILDCYKHRYDVYEELIVVANMNFEIAYLAFKIYLSLYILSFIHVNTDQTLDVKSY